MEMQQSERASEWPSWLTNGTTSRQLLTIETQRDRLIELDDCLATNCSDEQQHHATATATATAVFIGNTVHKHTVTVDRTACPSTATAEATQCVPRANK